MSGVIDEHGQWEHCHVCDEFVLIQNLLYEQPSERFTYGRDLCATCIELPSDEQDVIAERARQAAITRSMAHYTAIGWEPKLHADGSISFGNIH